MSPPQDTLRLLVCPPNATFVADGNIALNSVPLECVTYVIKEATLLMIARLMFFPLSRLPISLGIPLTRDRHLPHGVLIEPGVWLYEGGNVTVYLLSHGIFLLSFLRRTHLLFGMCSYDWVHCLILLSSLNSSFIKLWPRAVLLPFLPDGIIPHYSFMLTNESYLWTAPPSIQFSRIRYVFLITHRILFCFMEFFTYAFLGISS